MATRAAPAVRDIVYCHECENEWYRDEHGLTCPECHSDFTEVVEDGHDPRHDEEMEEADFEHDQIPDPDEDDISNMHWHPNVPGGGSYTYQANNNTGGTRPQGHPQEDALPPVVQGMASMLGTIMGRGLPGGFNHPGAVRGTTYQQPGTSTDDSNTPQQNGQPGYYVRTIDRPGFHMEIRSSSSGTFHRQTFGGAFGAGPQSGSFGGANFPGNGPQSEGARSPYDDLFASFGHFGPLFSNLFPGTAARSGDYAFSQEGFDQIISNLMEQNASGSAPGPASSDAIASLPTREITAKDLGNDGKAECSICMEEVFPGTTVTELPCHHWFHGECVKAWLAEHDTCPHCRQGIMPREGQGNTNRPRAPNEAPRHDQMWGQNQSQSQYQGQGTQHDPWVIPDSPTQAHPAGGRRLSRSSRESTGRRPSDNSGLLNRMRNAFGGGGGSSADA